MFCEPRSDAFDRATELYCKTAVARGAHPRLGPRLAGLFDEAGFEGVEADAIHPAFREGEGKQLAELTLRSIREAVLANEVIEEDDFDEILDELQRLTDDPAILLGLPRIHQVMGRVAP
jgi:hypothetical protein